MKDKLGKILELFIIFFKIGAFTFGGGYAMISMIENICVERKQWITHDEMMNVTVIAESTPGPIAINCATFVGYKTAGFWGAFCATLGVVLPSLFIIIAISFVLEKFQENKIVQYAFYGIRSGVLALIIKALISMYKQAPKGILPYTVMILSFAAVALFGINVLYVIIGCALTGIVSSFVFAKEAENDLS